MPFFTTLEFGNPVLNVAILTTASLRISGFTNKQVNKLSYLVNNYLYL